MVTQMCLSVTLTHTLLVMFTINSRVCWGMEIGNLLKIVRWEANYMRIVCVAYTASIGLRPSCLCPPRQSSVKVRSSILDKSHMDTTATNRMMVKMIWSTNYKVLSGHDETTLFCLTFLWPCITNIFLDTTNKMQRVTIIFYYRFYSTCFRRFFHSSSGAIKLYTQHPVLSSFSSVYR